MSKADVTRGPTRAGSGRSVAPIRRAKRPVEQALPIKNLSRGRDGALEVGSKQYRRGGIPMTDPAVPAHEAWMLEAALEICRETYDWFMMGGLVPDSGTRNDVAEIIALYCPRSSFEKR